jgi:hypothetical protein
VKKSASCGMAYAYRISQLISEHFEMLPHILGGRLYRSFLRSASSWIAKQIYLRIEDVYGMIEWQLLELKGKRLAVQKFGERFPKFRH